MLAGRDALFSPLESSLEVFGIDIDAVPGGHLVALSRVGQTFRASVTPSLREVGIWGMSALRLGKPLISKVHWCHMEMID